MGLTTALYTGLSGLNANAQTIDIAGVGKSLVRAKPTGSSQAAASYPIKPAIPP